MDSKQIAHLVKIYNSNPQSFDVESADALGEQARRMNVAPPKTEEQADFDMIDTAMQMVYGVGKGVTGIIDPGLNHKPKNQYEEIAKSVGELGGFLGLFFVPFGAAARLASGGLRAANIASGGLRFTKMVEAASMAEKGLGWARGFKSVPIAVGEKAISMFGIERAAAVAGKLAKPFGGGEMANVLAKQVVTGGIRMGAAGAVSSVTLFDGRDPGEYIIDAVMGGVYGMAFGGLMDAVPGHIGTLPFLKDRTTMAAVLKGMAGAVVNSVPSAIGGADMYRIGYEGVVGAYFGSKALTWKEYRSHEILSGDGKGWGNAPETHPEARAAYKDRPDILAEMGDFSRKMNEPQSAKNVLAYLGLHYAKKGGWEKVTSEPELNRVINNRFEHSVGDSIMEEISGRKISNISEVVRDDKGWITSFKGPDADGVMTEIPVTKAIRDTNPFVAPEVNDVEPVQIVEPRSERIVLGQMREQSKVEATPENMKVVSKYAEEATVDFEGRVSQVNGLNGAFRNVADTIFPAHIMRTELGAKDATNNLWLTMANHASIMRDPATRETSRGFDGFLEDLQGINPKVTAESVRELMPAWNSITQHVVIPHSSYHVDGKLSQFQIRGKMALDPAMNVVDLSGSRNAFHHVTGDDNAVEMITGYIGKDTKGNEEHSALNDIDLSGKDFVKMDADLGTRDKFLLGAAADKASFTGLKFIDEGLDIAGEYQKLIDNMSSVDPEFLANHTELIAEAEKNGMAPERYKRIALNKALYYERLNGIPLHEAMKSNGMIKEIVNFNKRLQIQLTNMYSLDESALAHFAPAGRELNYHAILVHDTKIDGHAAEDTDGSTLTHTDNMTTHHKAAGIPDGESHTKSFIYGEFGDGKGMMLVKHGEQRATKALSMAMGDMGLGYIMRPSGVKQSGGRKTYRMRFDGEKLEFIEGGKNDPWKTVSKDEVLANSTTLEPKNFHISSSIHDNIQAHLNHAVTYPKQGIYHMSEYETGKIGLNAKMNWIIDKFNGDVDSNARLDAYLADPASRKSGDLKNIIDNLDHTGVKKVLAAMESDAQLRGYFMQKIVGAMGNITESSIDGEGIASDIPGGLNGAKRLIAEGSDPNILYSRLGRKISEQAISRFVTSRLTHPKVKSAGKATMDGYTEDLRVHLNGKDANADVLNEENFFLGNTYKKLKIKGMLVAEDGSVYRGSTTLDKQHKSYVALEKKHNADKTDVKVSALYDEMLDVMNFAVTRVPMDSFSGTVRLRFAGFTGTEGGSILLHGNTKKQLGGADNDGDTAFFFHGMPKEYLKSLHEARGNFQKYADVITARGAASKTNEEKIFFKDAGELTPHLKNSSAAMLDVVYPAAVGHAVSKGRGSMLPVAVRYVDIMKKVLDTAYKNGGQITLKTGAGDEIILSARDFDGVTGTGETLGAYGQRAINSAADAGKEAGMVSQTEMKAILTASAFDRISINGKEIFNGKDGMDFNKENHANVLKALADFVGEAGYEGAHLMETEVGKYSKFLTTMFGYNTDQMRPYTLDEVNDAASKVPDNFETPYRGIIPDLANTNYHDGLLERIYPDKGKVLGFIRDARTFLKGNTWSKGILPANVFVEVENLQKHSELFNENYDPVHRDLMFNLATPKGITEFAGNEDMFNAYLNRRFGIYEKNGKTLAEMERQYGAFWNTNKKLSDAQVTEVYRATGKVPSAAEVDAIKIKARTPNIENRAKFLSDEKYQVQDYYSSRLEDIGSAAFIKQLTTEAGITDKDPGVIAEVYELSAKSIRKANNPSLLDLVRMVKYSHDMFHRKEWDLGKDKFGESLAMTGQESMRFALNAPTHVKRIAENINRYREANGLELVNPQAVADLYHGLLVSTVMRGSINGTGQQKLGLDVVPDRIISRYAKVLGSIWGESQKVGSDYDFEKLFRVTRESFPKEIELPAVVREDDAVYDAADIDLDQADALMAGMNTRKEPEVVTPKVEAPVAKATEPIAPPPNKTGLPIVQYVNLSLKGIDLENFTLTKKQQKVADNIIDFMEKRHHVFGNDLTKFFQMANEMVTNGPNNPNQWSWKDLEGLSNQLTRYKHLGTIFETTLNMFTIGDISKPKVGIPTWMNMPITNALRMMADVNDFYLKHIPIFGKGGKLHPETTPKTYQDDEGVLHTVYMEAAIPMNTLLRNLKAHASLDQVQSEIHKKAQALYEQFFSWYHGGMKDNVNGKDYTDAITKVATYRRELAGATLDADDAAAKQYMARELSVKEWDAIQGKTIRISEGGITRAMTADEAVKHTMDSMEGLSNEYRKYITLTDASIQKYFSIDAAGKLDYRATSQRFEGLLNSKLVDEVAPYDALNLFNYFMQLTNNAKKMVGSHKAMLPEEVFRLEAFDGVVELKRAHPMITNKSKAELYLRMYNTHMGTAKKPLDGSLYEGESKVLWDDAKKSADFDKLALEVTANRKSMWALGEYVYGRDLKASDIRSRVFGQKRHNQYDNDMAVHTGKMSTQDFYEKKLMNQFKFQETELINGWFPHRNFDPKVLDAQLKKATVEALSKESFSADDEKHFLALQDTHRRLKQEQIDPGSTADGKFHDALLSKDGILDMGQVVNQTTGALMSRTANLDGYNVEPKEMMNAILSVVRSGHSKLVGTLNNDAILKFEKRHNDAGVDVNITRPWIQYMRMSERQAFNRPSVFTNEMLNDPLTKIKWTPAYWLSDHALLSKPWSKVNRMYREIMKADVVTDLDKAVFSRKNGREMTKEEETAHRNERASRFLDFSTDANGEYTPRAMKNMENAAQMFKHFSQFEAKFEMASLLFHTRFAVNNVYGGVMNDYIYNGFAPLRKGRDIEYWNSINNSWKTMDDVHRFFESAGVIESILLKDTGYIGKQKHMSTVDKITDKAAYFMKKTEPWLRREAAMHGYISAREAMTMNNLPYDSPILINMARQSVEASQFLYNNHNRPAFMATNLGKVFTRFKLWGMNSLRMQGDIVAGAAGRGFKEGTAEMERYQRMMWANAFMFGLALMFPHTIFQSQLPQPIDTMVSLSGTFFGDDEKNKAKRKNLMTKMEDPIRDMLMIPTKLPVISFPAARVPLAIYDMPATFRAIWGHDVHDMATATTLNLLPFGRMTKDVMQAYRNPSMAAELIGGIPLHRISSFQTKAKKSRMMNNLIEQDQAGIEHDPDEVQEMMRIR